MITLVQTKYGIGDKVWHAFTATERKQHPCPDCLGQKTWKATSPAGQDYTFACPRCNASYRSFDKASLVYTAHVPMVVQRTIGSVRYDSYHSSKDNGKTEYMCVETGVGSGSIYREEFLFSSEEEALQVATLMAAKANAETSWIVELYQRSLEISDYQLSNALMKDALDYRQRIGGLAWNITGLFETIEGAEGKGDILEAIEEYRNFYLKADMLKIKEAMEQADA